MCYAWRYTMKKNMGIVDRVLRAILAVIVGVLFFTGHITGIAALVLGVFGVVFLITSFIGFCPLYVPLKLSTRSDE